jgi:hypothetical protein
MLKLERKVD